jgi:sugar-specific transcriptional regulator TrmB
LVNNWEKCNKLPSACQEFMMQEGNSYSQVLMKFGLTSLQATIYTTLVDIGKAGIMKISKASKIARPEVYRVIPSLQEKGLVEKVLSDPAMYRAIPLKQGLSMLLQQKTQESTELLEETKTLLSNIPEKTTNEGDKDDSQFIITSELKLFFKRLNKSINDSKRSIDFVTPNRGLYEHSSQFKKAMERSVKIRVLLTMTDKNQSIRQTVEDLKKNPLFRLKFTPERVVYMLISDNNILNTQISDGAVPSLLANNKQVVQIATTYFETLWNKAQDYTEMSEKKLTLQTETVAI